MDDTVDQSTTYRFTCYVSTKNRSYKHTVYSKPTLSNDFLSVLSAILLLL